MNVTHAQAPVWTLATQTLTHVPLEKQVQTDFAFVTKDSKLVLRIQDALVALIKRASQVPALLLDAVLEFAPVVPTMLPILAELNSILAS